MKVRQVMKDEAPKEVEAELTNGKGRVREGLGNRSAKGPGLLRHLIWLLLWVLDKVM